MTTRPRTRRAIAAAALAATAVITAAGCGDTPGISQRVCINSGGYMRVDDFRCGSSSMAYDWYYLPDTALAPAIGQRAVGGSLTRPRGDIRVVSPTGRTPAPKKAAPTTKKPDLKKKTDSGSKSKSGSKFGGSKSGSSRSGGGRR